MQNTTIREFDGGWNEIDNDLNLSSRYAKRFRNWYRAPDGSARIRFGTKLFVDMGSNFGTIVNMYYFSTFLICVDVNGNINAVNGAGELFRVWDSTIAADLPTPADGWSTTAFASFATFNGELIVCNGVDSPVLITSTLDCSYLYDLADGNNLFVPIARYVITADRYLVMAGDLLFPDRVHISNIDTSGTWKGASDPNDGITFDFGSIVPGDFTIRGINFYRDNLVVAFDEVTVLLSLGVFTGSDHTPTIADVIDQHGAVSHRTIQSLGDDMLFTDQVGVPSIRRALFTGQVTPDRVSQLIDPAIQSELRKLSTIALEDGVFSVYNRRENQYMLFIPNHNDPTKVTETRCYAYNVIPALKVKSWSEYRGWYWASAARSSTGLVFFSQKNRIYQYGDDLDNKFHAEYILDQQAFGDDTAFTDNTGWKYSALATNPTDEGGIPINFDWQLPWADFGDRQLTKRSRSIHLDTFGDAEFNVDMFVDNELYNRQDLGEAFTDGTRFTDFFGWLGEEPIFNPALTGLFVGGEGPGFGASEFGFSFGDGRVTNNELAIAWPAKYKIAKLRLHGNTMKPLRIVSIGLNYVVGNIGR
jgi:hypothetical protein